jgi:hypothetical protein
MGVFWIGNTQTVTPKIFGFDITSLTKVKTFCRV